jgi:hypothetical protein
MRRSARSLSWLTASTRAVTFAGSLCFCTCTKVAFATTCAPVSTWFGPTTTPEPLLPRGATFCHGHS